MTLLEALRKAHNRNLPPGTPVQIVDRTGIFVGGDVGEVLDSSEGFVTVLFGGCPQLLTRSQIKLLRPLPSPEA